MDETSIINGCRSRDRRAQRELYERHVENVYRLALRLTRNAQDAFDLSQDTFVRAFASIDAFGGRSSITTWLYRIATNEALQLFRRRQTEQRHLKTLARAAATSTETSQSDDGCDLDNELARLSDEHRLVLILKYRQGMSYDEIAEILDVQPGTISSRLHRARNELRRLLSEFERPREETDRSRHPKT